ncbi:hypothetical protein LTR85_001025 [Meristemomyces frigidus]|nr:hypothetical protein LTR85_001025 [Meristemomyces frigidus]
MVVNSKYEPLSAEDEGKEDSTPAQRRRTDGARISLTLLGTLFLITIVLVIGLLLEGQSKARPNTRPVLPDQPCGTSPEEALAAGCTFDPMMDSWLPPACYDDELTQQFRAQNHWEYFDWDNTTIVIDEHELSRRPRAKTTLHYHIAHCSYALRKLHRAIAQDRQIEVDVAAVGHTKHCVDMFQKMLQRHEETRKHNTPFTIEQRGNGLHPAYPKCMWARHVVGAEMQQDEVDMVV